MCNKYFRNIQNHIKSQHLEDNTPILCDYCDKTFLHQAQLNLHVKRMHSLEGDKTKLCYICDKKVVELKDHMNSMHAMENEIKCDFCDLNYFNVNYLKRHICIVHKGIKDIKCNLCEKSFQAPQALVIHLKTIHEKKKEFCCNICNKTFGTNSSLGVHKRNVHYRLKEKKCNHCEKCFQSSQSLNYHIQNVHRSWRNITAQNAKSHTVNLPIWSSISETFIGMNVITNVNFVISLTHNQHIWKPTKSIFTKKKKSSNASNVQRVFKQCKL